MISAEMGIRSRRHVLGAQEMIDEADRDGDGEVNEAEFFRIMKKTSLFGAEADPLDDDDD